MDEVIFKKPGECTPGELREFEKLVRNGSEVAAAGLAARIRGAHLLGFALNDGALVGVGALKIPEKNHRDDVAKKSGIPLSVDRIPFEIGWLYVLESERENKFGRRLMNGLMEAAGKSGVYGTSRLDEEHKPVHGALERRGFNKVGTDEARARRHIFFIRRISEWPNGSCFPVVTRPGPSL